MDRRLCARGRLPFTGRSAHAHVHFDHGDTALTATQLQLFYGNAANPTVWVAGVTTCAGNTEVPPTTIYVRASVNVTFDSLVAATVGHGSSTAGASARVRLSGTTVPLVGGPL